MACPGTSHAEILTYSEAYGFHHAVASSRNEGIGGIYLANGITPILENLVLVHPDGLPIRFIDPGNCGIRNAEPLFR